MTRQEIELVPVDDEKAPSVGKFVDGVFSDFNPPEKQPGISADEIVVVAWNVDDTRTLADFPQKLLHDIVVRLRPIPGALQPPAVENVADEVNRLCIMVAEKIKQQVRLTISASEMNIRDEQSPIYLRLRVRELVRRLKHDSCCSSMTENFRELPGA